MSTTRTLAAAGFILASALPALAQQKPQEPSKAHVQALIAAAMQQTTPTPSSPASQAVQPGAPAGPQINLTEAEAVARATERNLTLISERITPQTWDYSMAATRATYVPNLTSTLTNTDRTTLSSNVRTGDSETTSIVRNWDAGITQQLWVGGGNYTVNMTNQRQKTSSTGERCNPCYTTGVQATYVQPILRNRRIDNTRATILTNELNQDIADLNLSSQEVTILAQVRNAYWELVYAREAVEAAQRSLELATKLVGDNRARVEIGTMAPIDVVQAQAEEAARRQQVVTAQATLRNNELALKRLIVRGTDDEMWNAQIVPTDRPIVTAMPVDLESAVRNALSQRTDLAVAKKNLEASDITVRSLENQVMPALDFTGRLNLAGQAGVPSPVFDPITGQTLTPPAGNYLDALGNISSFRAPTWTVQLNFAYPIGTSAAKANVSRQKLLRQQTEASIKATELQIATEVTAAALAVRNSLEGLQASTVSRELSEQRLQAVQSKFDVGMSTNFEVVQAQRDLNDARNAELRQQLNYQRALVDFQRVQIAR